MPPVFQFKHRVTYAECTVGNHVYYSRYLDLLERARGEFFRNLNCSLAYWEGHDTAFPVLECLLKYKSPARYDDLLTIEVRLKHLEGIRLFFAHRIVTGEGKLVLEAETSHYCSSLNERPKRLPQEIQKKLEAYLNSGANPLG